MAEIRHPDYKSLFARKKTKRKEADSEQKRVEASRDREEARQDRAEASRERAEASRERAAASQERAEAIQKQRDEERQDWEHTRLTNFGDFLRHCHTYPPDR
ncbi:hypothetical protein N7463_010704 [Penicillium fimorum]|uniref:Uncharacterized protein n=1 Tax=Penicillium fimorum TaxID=1882269 RepID=A0A9X0C1J5_9EURO|nr:hypothetical protein N7463_010704 [Penicillium fimorum]